MAQIPKVVPGDIAQVVIESSVLNQRCLNVLYYKCELMDVQKTYAEAMDDLIAAVGNPAAPSVVFYMMQAMAGNTNVVNVRAQRVSPRRDIYLNQGIDGPGVLAPTCTLSNVAAVITKQTQIAGRGRQGSFHLAGLSADSIVAGSLTVQQVQRMNQIASKLEENINLGENVRWIPGTFTPNAPVAERHHEFFNLFAQTTARTMRRRTVGLGI